MTKRLLMIEANTTGTGMLMLRKALEMGFEPLFLTNLPERYKGLEQTGCSILICDTNSVPALQQAIGGRLDGDEILGVATSSEFYLESVAHLAAMYHVPGNAPVAMRTCRNKALTRLCLTEAGIEQPRFVIVPSPGEISNALERLSAPYVVKPIDDTGSYGVRLCQTTSEVEEQARHIFDMVANVRGQRTAQTVLIEEYLDAPEFSVEMFTWQGKITCLGITEKSVLGLPYFVEHRHIFPADLAPEQAYVIQQTVEYALEAVGVTHGATHTEVKLTGRGCAIIEINARPAGGMIPELMHLVLGSDLLEQQLKAVVGESPDLPTHRQGYAGIQFLTASVGGTLEGVKGIGEARSLDGIEQIVLTTTCGSRIYRPHSAYDRLGYIIAQAQTYQGVVSRLNKSLARLEILVSPAL